MASLLDLIKNDEGIQKLLSNIKGLGKGAARGLTTDTVGAPVDLVSGALSSLGVPVGDRPVGGSSWLRSILDQPTEDSPSELAGNLLSSVISPGKAAADVATLAPLLLGAIRPGGRPDLALVHDMAIKNPRVLDWWRSGLPMSNPSIAVTKNYSPFGHNEMPSILFNPNSHYFDPAFNPNNKLYNRDAYTTRTKGYSKAEQQHRMGEKDLRLTEGANPGKLHALAILASPEFKNFAQYEKAKTGANTLDKGFNWDQVNEVEDLIRRYGETLGENVYDRLLPQSFYKGLKHKVKAGDKDALQIDKMLQELGSDYAELKRFGELPLDDRTVRAMVIPYNGTAADTARYLKEGARTRGIKAGTPFDLLPQVSKEDIIQDTSLLLPALTRHTVNPGDTFFSSRSMLNDSDIGGIADKYNLQGTDIRRLHSMASNAADPYQPLTTGAAQDMMGQYIANQPPITKKLMNWLTRD